MFGFAVDETERAHAFATYSSHKLVRRLAELRKTGEIRYLRPDAKSQVTVEYDENDRPVVWTVVISTQHDPEVSNEQIHNDVINKVIKEVIQPLTWMQNKILHQSYWSFCNRWTSRGLRFDGRKIIVDTYGGYSRHGGGAFSGKED